jgi:hypothetical protein
MRVVAHDVDAGHVISSGGWPGRPRTLITVTRKLV